MDEGSSIDDSMEDDPLDLLAAATQPIHGGKAVEHQDGWFECPICQSQVTIAKMDGSGVCIDCARPRAGSRPTASSNAKPRFSGGMLSKPFVWIAVAVVGCVLVAGGYMFFQRYQYDRYAEAVKPLLNKLDEVDRKTSAGLKRYEMEVCLTSLQRTQAECATDLTTGQKKYSSWFAMDRAIDYYSQSVDNWKQLSDPSNDFMAKYLDSTIQVQWAEATQLIHDAHEGIKNRR